MPQDGRRILRIDDHDNAGKDHHTNADGDAGEQHDLRDILRIHAPMGVIAVTQGAAAQAGKTNALADRQADEGGKRDLGIGEIVLHIPHADPVEAGQAKIRTEGEGECCYQVEGWDCPYRFCDVGQGIFAERVIEQISSEAEADHQGYVGQDFLSRHRPLAHR